MVRTDRGEIDHCRKGAVSMDGDGDVHGMLREQVIR